MSSLALQPGAVLRGKYRVERVLGEGGMGIVVLATHLRMSQLVALKLLRPEARDRGDVVLRFAREARAASRLRGEHAVRILDVDDGEEGDPFLVMEFLEGTDLQRLLASEGALSVETTASYVLQICEGLAEAHAAGIVHRDLKPANVFLTSRPDGSPLVKILDFGISKAVEPDAPGDFAITKPATAIGSPSYMSPEQLKDAADVDARTDIWALGVIMYQLLTNTLPFEATSTAALAARIAADPPTPLRKARADVPEAFEALIHRCLEKTPAQRFPNVATLAQALAPFASRGDSVASRIARVAEATAQRGGPGRSTPPPPVTPATSGRETEPVVGSHTASVHAVVKPKHGAHPALVTEYGSTVASTNEREPVAKKSGVRWGLVAVVGAVALAGTAWFGMRAAGRASSPIATSASSVSPSPPAEPRSVGAAAANGERDSATAASQNASASPSAPRVRPRDVPPTKQPATGKNPLDLEFR